MAQAELEILHISFEEGDNGGEMPAFLVHIQGAVVIQVGLKTQGLGLAGPGDAQLVGIVLDHPGAILELSIFVHASLDDAISGKVGGTGALVFLFAAMLGGVAKALEQLGGGQLAMGRDLLRRKKGE